MAVGRRLHGQGPDGWRRHGQEPHGQSEKGVKRSILTEGQGWPLSVVLAGANTHDTKLLEATLEDAWKKSGLLAASPSVSVPSA